MTRQPWRSAAGAVLAGVCLAALAGGCTAAQPSGPGSRSASGAPRTAPSTVFPELTGGYQVGRRSYQFVDQTRGDLVTADPADKHSVIVTLYYPAGDTGTMPHASYVDPMLAQTLRRTWGAESEQFLATLVTHAYDHAPVARSHAPFPVVLFWPGTNLNALCYSTFLENLASHGYVAVGVTEPHNASWDDLANAPATAGAARLTTWAQDEPFILQKLSGVNNTDFGGVMDLNTVAVGGHSGGGDAATEAADEHPNLKALLSFDAIVWLDNQPPVPALFKARPPVPSMLLATDVQRGQFTHHFLVRGIVHDDFAPDDALLDEAYPTHVATDRGTVPPARVLELMNTYVVAFFDRYLKGVRTSLLDGNSRQYPEMRYLGPNR
jgi:predicted dienelactone hydrolase